MLIIPNLHICQQIKNFVLKIKSGIFQFSYIKIEFSLIFSNDDHQNNYFAFGDSQLLGIDWDET